jgi:hypothetical protein
VARSADSPGVAIVGDDEVEVRARLVELEASDRWARQAAVRDSAAALDSHEAIVGGLEAPTARAERG